MSSVSDSVVSDETFKMGLADTCPGSSPPPRPSFDPDPDEVLDYPIIREELQVLARYWYRGYLEREIDWFFHTCVSGSDRRFCAYAFRRLDQIGKVLGEGAMNQAIGQVQAEERRSLGHEVWRVFTEGSAAEQEAFVESKMTEVGRLEVKCSNEEACCAAFEYLSARPAEVFIDPIGDLWRFAEPFGDDVAQHLVLTLRDRSGCGVYATKYTLARPTGWSAPTA